jgi:hypothetical protein
VYPPIVAREWLGKNVTTATNKHKKRRIVGCLVFYVVPIISKEAGD